MKHLHVKTTGFEMTPAVSEYLDEKIVMIEKLYTTEDDDAVQCDVELAHHRDQHRETWRADMTLSVHGDVYRASANGETMQAAIDEVKDEISKRLRRSSRKRFDMLRKGGATLKRWMKFGRE